MNKAKRLDELVGGIEALLGRLPLGLTPEIAALRDRVDAEIFDAWTTISRERARNLKRLRRASSPHWVILGLTLLTASLLVSRLAQARALEER